jgi:hypothetical protein
MTKETSNKLSAKKEQTKKTNKMEDKVKKHKKHVDSDDDDENFISESESDEMDVHEYRKFLSKIFPSKHLDKKIATGERIKKIQKQLEAEDEEEWVSCDDDDEYYEDDEYDEEIITRSKSKAKSKAKAKVIAKANKDCLDYENTNGRKFENVYGVFYLTLWAPIFRNL